MDKYKNAFGNLTVPDDMADRILRADEKTADEKSAELLPVKKQKLIALYRVASGIAACLVLGLSLWIIHPQQAAQVSPEPSMPVVGTSAPGESAAPVEMAAPSAQETVPAGSKTSAPPATVPAGQTNTQTPAETGEPGNVQIENPVEELTSSAELIARLGYAPKLPTALPSGFSESGAAIIGGKTAQVDYADAATTVCYRTAKGNDDVSGDCNAYSEQSSENGLTLKGDDGQVSLAVWNDETYSYSLSFSPGVPKQTALNWVGRIR